MDYFLEQPMLWESGSLVRLLLKSCSNTFLPNGMELGFLLSIQTDGSMTSVAQSHFLQWINFEVQQTDSDKKAVL